MRYLALFLAEGLLFGLKTVTAVDYVKGSPRKSGIIRRDKRIIPAWLVVFAILSAGYYARPMGLGIWMFLDLMASYLLLTVIDIKTRTIPDEFLLYTVCSQLLFRLFLTSYENLLRDCLTGIVVYVILMLLSVIAKGGIGMGDVKLLALTTVITGGGYLVQILFFGLLCAFVYSAYLLAHHRGDKKTELPFVPFLTCGMMIHLILSLI